MNPMHDTGDPKSVAEAQPRKTAAGPGEAISDPQPDRPAADTNPVQTPVEPGAGHPLTDPESPKTTSRPGTGEVISGSGTDTTASRRGTNEGIADPIPDRRSAAPTPESAGSEPTLRTAHPDEPMRTPEGSETLRPERDEAISGFGSPSAPDPDEIPPADEEDGEEDGLYEHFSVTADKGQTPLRLDKFLTVRMEHCSRNRIQAAADSGNILVNDRPAKSSYKVKPLDRIRIVMPYPRREVEIIPEDIPLDIVYEDDDLLIVDKAAGMVVHPGHGNYSGTLVNALTFHLQALPMFREGDMRAGLVHRIDKNTSGLLVVAKNEQAHARLAKQFFDHTISRRYVALVWGNFDQDEGTITGNIGRSPRDRLKMFVFEDGSDGKHAVTHWRVLRRYGYVTLVECRLETGRTHQIRVHMAWQGHPLFNDERYGGDRILKGTTFAKYRQFIENCFTLMPRHALHARSLGFVHPATHREMHFESDLPEDFRALVAKWDAYVAAADTFRTE